MKLIEFRDLRGKGISRSRVQVWRWVRSGQFPRPIKLGSRRNAWIEAEIDGWLAARVAERDAHTAATV